MESGPGNRITDVAGVRVGHRTVTDPGDPSVQTGVTVVLPHGGNVFREKLVAACHVINGFGKAVGLVQVEELGQLESPIALTNTLSVPAVTEGVLDLLLAENPDIGLATGSANAVVAECNDSLLNDMRGRHVRREHVADAVDAASDEAVEQGAVGAGRGMVAFGLKGGVGTASRVVRYGDTTWTVGVLVLSNFGSLEQLTIAGRPVGAELARELGGPATSRGGESVIVVLATDAPFTSRQLRRLLRRVQNGIARTGSTTGSGSGEIALGFTTAFRIPHSPETPTVPIEMLREDGNLMDSFFAATAEATEEAIINSLINAKGVEGRAGERREGLPLDLLGALVGGPGRGYKALRDPRQAP
jgi:D-aminopeptidase